MKKLTRLMGIAIVLSMSILLVFPAQAQKKVEIVLQAGSKGMSGYPLTFGLGELINEKSSWLRAEAVESTGSVADARTIIEVPNAKYNHTGYGTIFTLYAAAKGEKPFKVACELNLIACLMDATEALVTLNLNLKTPKDLVGKTVANLPAGIGNERIHRAMFEHWGIFDKVKWTHGSYEKIAQGLIDGTIDIGDLPAVGVMERQKPNPALEQLLSTGKNVYYYPIVPADVIAARKILGWPEIAYYTQPPKTISDRQLTEKTGYLHFNAWWCHPDMDKDIVYEICRILNTNYNVFRNYHAVATDWTADYFAKGFGMPYHAGAVKYCKDHGIKIGR